jgi:hypothetical protein
MKLLLPEATNPAVFATVATAIWPIEPLCPLTYVAVTMPFESTAKPLGAPPVVLRVARLLQIVFRANELACNPDNAIEIFPITGLRDLPSQILLDSALGNNQI